jgi:hypothetical protein
MKHDYYLKLLPVVRKTRPAGACAGKRKSLLALCPFYQQTALKGVDGARSGASVH